MQISTLHWIDLPNISLLATIITVSVLALALTVQNVFASVGWVGISSS